MKRIPRAVAFAVALLSTQIACIRASDTAAPAAAVSASAVAASAPAVAAAPAPAPAVAASASAATPARDADYARITILSTTDLHGHVYPVDYYTGKPSQDGLAKIATLIRQARQDAPRALLLDIGDVIQGTPLTYYHNRINNTPADPMMLCMNALGYDSMTPGNHEYNFGLDVLNKARGEAAFPWLSANTVRAGTDTPAYVPYFVKEVDGVRVGVIGITTPGIPGWEDKPNYAGLEFRDPVETAAKYVELLRGKENADVVVIAMHMGLEIDLRNGKGETSPQPRENTAIEIAENVPGVDLIFMGHTHRDIPALVVGNALLAQANRWGTNLVRADLYLAKTDSRWRIVARSARSIAVDDRVAADPEILALAEPYHRETQTWLDKVIGKNARELTAADSRMRDTAIIDLIQRVQLESSGAEVSFSASFNPSARIRSGDVTVRDLYSLYTYENTLTVVALTGAQIKAALEHSARYYERDEKSGKIGESTDIPGYNCDMAEGVTYEVDPAREAGGRILNLRWQGKPIDPARTFRVAVNNYRLNGGGGYTMFKNAPVLWRSSTEIRDLLINWVETHGEIPAEPTNNWRIIGMD